MIERLAELLGLPLDAPHLEEALTHPSFANEQRTSRHNQRLEFLGDAVLELLTSEYLLNTFPDWSEGQLSKSRARLVVLGPQLPDLTLPETIRRIRALADAMKSMSVHIASSSAWPFASRMSS